MLCHVEIHGIYCGKQRLKYMGVYEALKPWREEVVDQAAGPTHRPFESVRFLQGPTIFNTTVPFGRRSQRRMEEGFFWGGTHLTPLSTPSPVPQALPLPKRLHLSVTMSSLVKTKQSQ